MEKLRQFVEDLRINQPEAYKIMQIEEMRNERIEFWGGILSHGIGEPESLQYYIDILDGKPPIRERNVQIFIPSYGLCACTGIVNFVGHVKVVYRALRILPLPISDEIWMHFATKYWPY